MKLSSTSEVRCQPQDKVALLCIYSGRPGIYHMIGGQISHDFQLVVLREANLQPSVFNTLARSNHDTTLHNRDKTNKHWQKKGNDRPSSVSHDILMLCEFLSQYSFPFLGFSFNQFFHPLVIFFVSGNLLHTHLIKPGRGSISKIIFTLKLTHTCTQHHYDQGTGKMTCAA